MTDLLFQVVFSNICISLVLAVAALFVGSTFKRPQLAYLLWLLVFIKLMTPPLISIPIGSLLGLVDNNAITIQDRAQFDTDAVQVSAVSQINGSSSAVASRQETLYTMIQQAKPWLLLVWLLGSGCVFAWSLTRIYRFDHLLKMETDIGPESLQTLAASIARRLKIKAVPTIYTTSAHLSPLVWWIGGAVRIVIPSALLDYMPAQQSQLILAHELAHVRRRDYLVRWLEWLTCVCLWWNPLVWWARRHLRATEEICCDALVISSMNPAPRTYAGSLLNAIEYLASPVIRRPMMASEITSGGYLKRRFKMIVSQSNKRSNSLWMQACVLLLAVVLLPLGLAFAGTEAKEAEISAEGKVLEVEIADDDNDDEAKEEEIALANVPKIVTDAALKKVPGIKLTEAVVETTKKGNVYDLEGTAEGKEYELEISAEGKVLEVEIDDDGDDGEAKEEEIALANVPKIVSDAALKKVPGIHLTEAVVETTKKGKVYDLEGTAEGKEYEIEISAEGKILEVEIDDDDDKITDDDDA